MAAGTDSMTPVRYRLLDRRKRSRWVPVTLAFEYRGEVFYFTPGRRVFQKLEAATLEEVRPEHLARSRCPGRPGTYRLRRIAEVEFPEHELQRQGKRMAARFGDPAFGELKGRTETFVAFCALSAEHPMGPVGGREIVSRELEGKTVQLEVYEDDAWAVRGVRVVR